MGAFHCDIHHNAMIPALVLTAVNNLYLGFEMNNENRLLHLLSKNVTARIKRQMEPARRRVTTRKNVCGPVFLPYFQ